MFCWQVASPGIYGYQLPQINISLLIRLWLRLETPGYTVLSSPPPKIQDLGLIQLWGCASAHLIRVPSCWQRTRVLYILKLPIWYGVRLNAEFNVPPNTDINIFESGLGPLVHWGHCAWSQQRRKGGDWKIKAYYSSYVLILKYARVVWFIEIC